MGLIKKGAIIGGGVLAYKHFSKEHDEKKQQGQQRNDFYRQPEQLPSYSGHEGRRPEYQPDQKQVGNPATMTGANSEYYTQPAWR